MSEPVSPPYKLRRRSVRVPLPPNVPVTVRLPEALARRLALWLAVHGWSRNWWH